MDSNEKINKIDSPIYVGLPTLKKLIEILSTRNFSKITPNDLQQRGFAQSVSFQIISGLRFLDILDFEGNTTEKARILTMQGAGKQEKMEAWIREAYKKLFDTVPNAETLSKNELHDEFMAVYDVSSRLADTAAPAFLWLSSLAGLKVTEVIEVKTRASSPTKLYKKPEAKKIDKQNSSPTVQPQYGRENNNYLDFNIAGLILSVPKQPKLEDAIAAGDLAPIRKAIIEFANTHNLIEENKLSETQESGE
jgi:uncharacterized protein DUF5343